MDDNKTARAATVLLVLVRILFMSPTVYMLHNVTVPEKRDLVAEIKKSSFDASG